MTLPEFHATVHPARVEGGIIVTCEGVLDARNYPVALECLRSSIRLASKAVFFDLAGLRYFNDFGYHGSESPNGISGSGIPFVDVMLREPAGGRWFAFCAFNPKVRGVWEMLGFHRSCPTFASIAEAEAAWLQRDSAKIARE